MELTKEELESPLWRKLEYHIQGKMAVCRKTNDKPMPEGETCMIRGEIKAYKSILRLNKEFND